MSNIGISQFEHEILQQGLGTRLQAYIFTAFYCIRPLLNGISAQFPFQILAKQALRIDPGQDNKFYFTVPRKLLHAKNGFWQLYSKLDKVSKCLDAVSGFHGYFTLTETIDPSGATVVL